MMNCPLNGLRNINAFVYGGQVKAMPDHRSVSDAEWADYLFNRTNTRGDYRELWNHAQGCRRWFGVERDTVTYKIAKSYRLSDGKNE